MNYYVCAGECADTVLQRLEDEEQEERDRLDRQYEEMVKKANEEFGMEEYYQERMEHFRKVFARRERSRRRSRRSRCSIM